MVVILSTNLNSCTPLSILNLLVGMCVWGGGEGGYCVLINVVCLAVLHLSPVLAAMVWIALDLYGLLVKEISIF